MESGKPLVPWGFPGPIIAIKELVVKLVEKVSYFEAFGPADLDVLKSGMGCRRANAVMEEQENHMNRVCRQQEENHRVEHQEETLNRMHGKAGPWSCLDVLVMPGVNPGIKLADMQQTVQPVKVKARPDRNQNNQGNKPDGVTFKGDHGCPAIGV